MSGFTKGPWQFIDATKVAGMHFKPLCVIKAGDKQVASFSWNDNSKWFPTKDESQANARLIAASPAMYEALVKAESHLAAIGTPRDSMGRYNKDGEWTFNEALPRNVDAAEVSAAFAVIRAALSKAAGEGR